MNIRHAIACLLLFSSVSALPPVFPTRAHAQENAAAQDAESTKIRAKQMFEQGVSEYEAGQYTDALESFLEAYRLKPHPMVRVNIANCYDKLDRPVEAISSFELFLGSGLGSAQQKAEIKEAVKNLKKRVGKLVLLVSPDGAKLTIDNTDQRVAPIKEPISLHSGRHKLTAELDGYEPVEREFEVKGDSSTEVSIRLERATAAPIVAVVPVEEPATAKAEPVASEPAEQAPAEAEPAAAPEAAAEATDTTLRKGIPSGVWVAGSFTLAFAIAGTVTGILAKSAERNFNANLAARFEPSLTAAQQGEAWSNASTASNRTYALAITTDALFACAIVGAGITTYLFLTRNKRSNSETAFVPALTPTSASLVAHTRF